MTVGTHLLKNKPLNLRTTLLTIQNLLNLIQSRRIHLPLPVLYLPIIRPAKGRQ
mgnify:CR=1 FL=1